MNHSSQNTPTGDHQADAGPDQVVQVAVDRAAGHAEQARPVTAYAGRDQPGGQQPGAPVDEGQRDRRPAPAAPGTTSAPVQPTAAPTTARRRRPTASADLPGQPGPGGDVGVRAPWAPRPVSPWARPRRRPARGSGSPAPAAGSDPAPARSAAAPRSHGDRARRAAASAGDAARVVTCRARGQSPRPARIASSGAASPVNSCELQRGLVHQQVEAGDQHPVGAADAASGVGQGS